MLPFVTVICLKKAGVNPKPRKGRFHRSLPHVQILKTHMNQAAPCFQQLPQMTENGSEWICRSFRFGLVMGLASQSQASRGPGSHQDTGTGHRDSPGEGSHQNKLCTVSLSTWLGRALGCGLGCHMTVFSCEMLLQSTSGGPNSLSQRRNATHDCSSTGH